MSFLKNAEEKDENFDNIKVIKCTVLKNEITKIKYLEKVDIIYTEKNYFICTKGSLEDWGQVIAFEFAKKEKGE